MNTQRWAFLDYFRVAAMFLVMWPHLTALINPQWKVLIGVQWLVNRPLHIIQNFGALGVCYFLLISGFLLNRSTESPLRFIIKKIKNVYFALLILMLVNFLFIFTVEHVFGYYTYWHQFTLKDWIYSATTYKFILGEGDGVNGVLWYIVPCFFGWLVFSAWRLFGKSPLSFPIFFNLIILIVVYLPESCFEAIEGIKNLGIYAIVMIFGYLIGCFFRNDISKKQIFSLTLLSYFTTVLAFYKLQNGYYEAEPYILSMLIAVLTFFIGALLNDYFLVPPVIKILCQIFFPFYVLHSVVGGCIISLLFNHLPFVVCFLAGIIATLLLSLLYKNTSILIYSVIKQRLHFLFKGGKS